MAASGRLTLTNNIWTNKDLQLTEKQDRGMTGGMIGAMCSAAFFLPATVTVLPWLAVVGAAAVAGSVVGGAGAGEHAGSADGAFVLGIVEGATAVGSFRRILAAPAPQMQPDIHGPHPEPCRRCGRWLMYSGEPHFCNLVA